MKRILRWLKKLSSQAKNTVADDQPSEPDSVKPDDYQCPSDVSLGAEVAGWMDNHESKQDDYVDTVPDLEILDLDSSEADRSTGFGGVLST